jgi:hypothetical protein
MICYRCIVAFIGGFLIEQLLRKMMQSCYTLFPSLDLISLLEE